MVFDKQCVKHSLEFSSFFSFLHQLIDSKEKTRWQLIHSTNIKYKLCKSQNYLCDCYNLISRTKTDVKLTKRLINKHRVSQKKEKTRKIGDLSTRFFISNTFWRMQDWNRQKIRQILSNTLRLNYCCLKIIHIVYPSYCPKIIGHILKNKQKNRRVCFHEIIWLIIIKMKMKMKNKQIT